MPSIIDAQWIRRGNNWYLSGREEQLIPGAVITVKADEGVYRRVKVKSIHKAPGRKTVYAAIASPQTPVGRLKAGARWYNEVQAGEEPMIGQTKIHPDGTSWSIYSVTPHRISGADIRKNKNLYGKLGHHGWKVQWLLDQ